MPGIRTRSRSAFTLIELLVVIAIIAILVGLLLVAVQRVREAANRLGCINNLKQIGLALHHYHDANSSFPPGSVAGRNVPGRNPGGWAPWTVYLLPYFEQDTLQRRYDFGRWNNDPANTFVRGSLVKVYVCPSDASGPFQPLTPTMGYEVRTGYMPGSYRGVAGRGDPAANQWFDSQYTHETDRLRRGWRGPLHVTGISGLRPERLADISDGTANTLLVGEYTTRTETGRRTFWAYSWNQYTLSSGSNQPRIFGNDYEACLRRGGVGDDQPCKRGWGSFHLGVTNFTLCDGSVRTLSTDINIELFSNLTTIAGGEVINEF